LRTIFREDEFFFTWSALRWCLFYFLGFHHTGKQKYCYQYIK